METWQDTHLPGLFENITRQKLREAYAAWATFVDISNLAVSVIRRCTQCSKENSSGYHLRGYVLHLFLDFVI